MYLKYWKSFDNSASPCSINQATFCAIHWNRIHVKICSAINIINDIINYLRWDLPLVLLNVRPHYKGHYYKRDEIENFIFCKLIFNNKRPAITSIGQWHVRAKVNRLFINLSIYLFDFHPVFDLYAGNTIKISWLRFMPWQCHARKY